MALERGERARDGGPLGNRNAIVIQGPSDAPLAAGPNQFVFPLGPFLVANLPLSPHRSHLDNLTTTVEWALRLAMPRRRSGGSLPRGACLAEKTPKDIDHPLRARRRSGIFQEPVPDDARIRVGHE